MSDEKRKIVGTATVDIKPGEIISITMSPGTLPLVTLPPGPKAPPLNALEATIRGIRNRHNHFLEMLCEVRKSPEDWRTDAPVLLAMLHTEFTSEWFQDLLQKIREIPYGSKNPEVYISVPVEDLSNQKYADMPGITPTGTGPQILYNIVDAAVHAEGGYYQLAGYAIEPCTVAGIGESHKMTFKLKPTTLVDIVDASSSSPKARR